MNLDLKGFIGSIVPDLTRQMQSLLSYDTEIEDGHREKTGAYYTPMEMAIEMVLDAVSHFLKQKIPGEQDAAIESFFNREMSRVQAQEWLDQIAKANWLDMASGTGVFALAYLRVIQTLAKGYAIDFVPIIQAVSANMMVSDINCQAIARLKELMHLAFGSELPLTYCIGDTLTELHRQPPFQKVLADGGFDIIIGNPPYLGERGNKAVFQGLRQSSYLAPYYEGKMDLFYFFLRLGIKWLSANGVLTQITTHYFTTADGAKNLRKQMQDETDLLVLHPLNTSSLFKDVKSLCFLSFTLKRRTPYQTRWEYSSDDTAGEIRLIEVSQSAVRPMIRIRRDGVEETISQESLYDAYGHMKLTDSGNWAAVLHQFDGACLHTLGQILEINQGIVSGADRLRESHRSLLNKEAAKTEDDVKLQGPIFVFETHELPVDAPKAIFKPFVKNSHIKPFHVMQEGFKRVLYTDCDEFSNYPEWLAHLEEFQPILSLRREVQSGLKSWYQLQWGRNQIIFERPKIIVPQRAKKNQFAFWEEPLYGSADVYFLGSQTLDIAALKAYTAYLNSAFVHLWLYHYGKRKGDLLELYASPLGKIPVPQFTTIEMNCLCDWYQACFEYHNGPESSKTSDAEIHDPEFGLHRYLCAYFGFDRDLTHRLWSWHQGEEYD